MTPDPALPGPPPDVARELFGERLDVAERYARLLAGAGTERGLLGPREGPRIWERHLVNSAVVAEALPSESGDLVDLGSGAGLPGIPLAIRRPGVHVTLLEPLERRADFLRATVGELGLPHVRVVRSRAEDHHAQYHVVVARAVAPLDRLAGWMGPMLRNGGTALALKGERATDELEAAREACGRAGFVHAEVVTLPSGDRPLATVIRLTKGSG